MSTKKSGFFSNLFSRKKSNKENELPETQQEQFYRTQSVRGSRRPHRTSHFEEGYSPEYPNPYHGNVKPRKHPRGPQSCPGGVRDDSYHEEQHYEESRSQYGRPHPRHEKFRRSARDTSEYGSGDPSPITMSSRHHYNTSLIDDSETEDYRGESRVSKYNDLEKECEILRDKCHHANLRKDYYKANLRRMKVNKDQIEDAFNDRMKSLKAENEMLRQQLGIARAELSRIQQQHQQYNSFAHQNSFFQPQSHTQQMFSSSGYANFLTPRASVPTHHAPMSGSALTAGTSSTLESTLAGAGEALAQPSDMSFQPQFDSSFSAKSFADEDEDNVKNFSNFTFDEKHEAPRANISTSSLGISPQREIRLIRQSDESHASSSTVVADEMYPPSKSGSGSTLRRTASDGILN